MGDAHDGDHDQDDGRTSVAAPAIPGVVPVRGQDITSGADDTLA
jgi:hypothetical protein